MADPREDAFATPESEGESLLFRQFLGVLRGRYRLVSSLAVVAAIAFAALGWAREQPLYQSSGMIRVTPLMQRLLYTSQTEQNAPPPAPGIFEAFVQSQVSIIRSQQVIDRVMQTREWRETGEADAEGAMARFWRRFEVHHPPRTELIRVSFSHPDPDVATLAVKLLIGVYQQIQGQQSTEERIQAHMQSEAELSERIEKVQDEITSVASRHGTTDLNRLFNLQMMALSEIESAYRGTRIDLIMAESSSSEADLTDPSAEEIAAFDNLMRSYLEKRHKLETEIAVWQELYTPKMPGFDQLLVERDQVENQIETRRSQLVAAGATGGGGPKMQMGPRAVEILSKREVEVKALYDDTRRQTIEIGMDDLRVQTLRSEAELVQERLDKIRGRIEQLRVESSVIGRINVISGGDRPLVPISDRRMMMAVAGGTAGSLFAVALVIAWGFLEGRLRYSTDVSVWHQIPLLGVLPEIDEGSGLAPEVVLRDMRWSLELIRERESLQTIALAGETAGVGASSIALALGVSFAGTGTRTALVDLQQGSDRVSTRIASAPEDRNLADDGGTFELATGIENLTVIDPSASGPTNSIRASAIRDLLDDLSARFGVVLVDCGALDSPGGVILGCALAEGSVLVCARGSSHSKVATAVERLDSCNARTLGAVFNRALAGDTPGSVTSDPAFADETDSRFNHLGPLAANLLRTRGMEV